MATRGCWLAMMASLLVLAPAGPRSTAATFVVPAANSAIEGDAVYGLNSNLTFQQVYGAGLLGDLPAGSVITGFSLRLNGGLPASPSVDLTSLNFDVLIGSSRSAPGSLDMDFANNLGPDTVLARSGSLTFLAGSYPGSASPNDFGPEITFANPYTYGGGDLLLTLSYTDPSIIMGLLLDAQRGQDAQGIQGPGYNAATANASNVGYALIVRFNTSAPSVVPEPASLVMVGLAIAVGYALRRRRAAA